jgi:hypothetical protein
MIEMEDKTAQESQKRGDLFERAARILLKELFTCWGYVCLESHRQNAGSQHGGDIFFKLSKKQIPLYIFVECKASASENEIDVYELKKKIEQFDWAGFQYKDIHLFLSLTRGVKFDNQVKPIEDDFFPFIIIDWMQKPGIKHPFVDLFFAYQGDCPDILEYREELRGIYGQVLPTGTFPSLAGELYRDFERRINEYYGREYRQGCQFISGAFWQMVLDRTRQEFAPAGSSGQGGLYS